MRVTLTFFYLALFCFPVEVVGDDISPSVQIESIQKERKSLATARDVRPSNEDAVITRSTNDFSRQESEGLAALDSILAQHEGTLRELLVLNQKRQDAKLLLDRVDSFEPDEEKPYSFLKLDLLRDSLENEVLTEKTLTTDLKSAKQRSESAKADLAERQKATDHTRSQASSPADNLTTVAEQKIKLATQRLALRLTEVELLKSQLAICELTQKQLNAKIAVYEKGVKFTVDDRETKVSELKKNESMLQSQKVASELHIERLVELQTRLGNQLYESLPDEVALHSIAEAIEKCQAVAMHSIQVTDCLVDAQLHWKHRFELHNSAKINLSNLKDWKGSLDDLLESIESYLVAIHRKRESIQTRSTSSRNENEIGVVSQDSKLACQEAGRFFDSAMAKCVDQLQTLKAPLIRFRKELRDSISKTASAWSSNPIDFIKGVFSYEVVEVNEEGIPVSRALLLLFLIALGIYISYLASKLIARFVFPYLGVKPGVAVALRSIVRYTLCIVSGIVAFKMMGIPLTAFAFLGGAAAIAVGFGSQDVMNNFMSGVILLTEQPIRVGDVILLSENQCIVTHIGLRSTRLRNYQNHELIVPNTLLIEKLVTNLTLSDNLLRLVVPLVVDRTEPINESMKLIIQALKKESRVRQEMEPIVLLKEVDTYYLTFEVHFTIEFADPMESLVEQSNILTVIGQLFPSKANNLQNTAESTEELASGSSTQVEVPGKLTKDQLEKEIKKLQAFLVKKM